MALATPAAVVLEIMTMGQQSAAHLGDLLRAASPAGLGSSSSPPQRAGHQELADEILRCCGRVIAALTATNTGTKKRKAEGCSPSPVPPPKRRARGAGPLKEVTSCTTVDGFIWRKYGQKDINGSSHPRLYYRCAYREQGCTATRRVQRSEEEPAAYQVAYYGEHTCTGAAAACYGAAAPPAVVDFGSNAWSWGGAPAWDGEMSLSQGWSSASSEAEEFGAVQAHAMPLVEEPNAARGDGSPVLEFLDGCFDWEFAIEDPFDFDGLLLPGWAVQ